METNEPGLVRYWFEFDLTGHKPDDQPGHIYLDGGSQTYHLLGRDAGATGYDEADCLRLLREAIDDELPPVLHAHRNPAITEALGQEVGNAAWRGEAPAS